MKMSGKQFKNYCLCKAWEEKKLLLLERIFISGMGILKVTIDLSENKIVNFEQIAPI